MKELVGTVNEVLRLQYNKHIEKAKESFETIPREEKTDKVLDTIEATQKAVEVLLLIIRGYEILFKLA